MADIQQLIQELGNPTPIKRREAVTGLKALGQAAVEPLITALATPDGLTPALVIPVLAEIGDARAVEPLIRVLDGSAGVEIKEAAKALGAFQADPRAVDALKRFARKPGNRLRALAIYALWQLDAHRVGLDFWLDMLQTTDDPDIAWRAANQLGKLGSASAFDPLRAAIDRWIWNEIPIRFSFDAWLSLDRKPTVEDVLPYLKSDDPITRGHAARALGLLGDVRALDSLKRLVNDPGKVSLEEYPAQYITVERLAKAAIQQIQKANGISE